MTQPADLELVIPMAQPVYLDCNATTPLEPAVLEVMQRYLVEEFGNEGSRTHEYGARAKQAVQKARDQVGQIVGAQRDEVIFTSGATEANNLAILGLAEHGEKRQRKHIISTLIEHKAVLEPLEELERRGFEVEMLAPNVRSQTRKEGFARFAIAGHGTGLDHRRALPILADAFVKGFGREG